MSADLKESPTPLAEISQGPNAFEAFLDRNQKAIVVFAIALAIAAVAAVVYRGVETSRQQTAGAALTKAQDLASLQAVVDGHPDTVAGASAMVLLADNQWTAGKQDDAIGTLRKFIDSSPKHPALHSAKANLASKLMAQGKSGDATRIFEELASDPEARFIAPFALISLGDIAKAAGAPEKAESFYNRVKSEFPDSGFAETANRRTATLKAKPPVEIAPPPVAPTPPAATTPPPIPAPGGSPNPSPEKPGSLPATPQP